MIEDRIEERKGILRNLKLGYSKGIELTKRGETCYIYPRDDNYKGSFLERTALDCGASFAWFYFPYIHPIYAFNNLKNRFKKEAL